MVMSPGRRAEQHHQEFALGGNKHRANGNKQNCHITRCSLTSGNRPTVPQCGKEGIVPFGWHSRDVKL